MSGFDVHSLEAYSTIASVTGTNPDLTITVQTGDGAKFGNPQNVTIWPSGVQPTLANSTIGRISDISTDTLTVTTAQEGSSNITVSAGMQIANTITPKVLTDIESGGLLTNTAIANGGIDYANLLSTIFSGQVTSYTNNGSAGGTFYYANIGGIKFLWGVTAACTSGANSVTNYVVNIPPGFFTTIEYSTCFIQVAIVSVPNNFLVGSTVSTSGIEFYVNNQTGANGVGGYVSVFAIGS